jgi:hypothetical protein
MALTPRIVLGDSTALSPTDRIGRYPKHTFAVESKPFSVTPIGIAPVLPGETLRSIFMESRVITDPIKNAITGWKKDYFFFYLKATSLAGVGDAFRAMFVDLDDQVAMGVQPGGLAVQALDNKPYYTAKGAIPYLERCIREIVNNYFRDEGEVYDNKPLINGYPVAQIREASWMDSLTDKDLIPDQLALDAASDTGDFERLLTAYETLRSLGLANISWDEYLASVGIEGPKIEETNKPVLLFHTNNFQYPSNTVNPADGTPSSAVSWVFREGENKKRKFFKEPGFVVGVTVTRPKVFFQGQAGSMTAHLERAWDWLPELLLGAPSSSLKKYEPGTGPLGDRVTDTDGYFVDMRDLFVHGDQFTNRNTFDPNMISDGAAFGGVNLPDVALNWKYPTEAMVNNLFKTPASATLIREDGYFSMSIQGKQKDTTPNPNRILV